MLVHGDAYCAPITVILVAGAVVLSNGDARAAASHNNTKNNTSIQQSTATGSDADLAALSTEMGYNQALRDINILTSDITPAVSGKITFSYVFGSEEYEEYSPSPSECKRRILCDVACEQSIVLGKARLSTPESL
jgi:hypothetical protein